jgi:tRNA modification GTPase
MDEEDEAIIDLIEQYFDSKPFVCIVNKVDLPKVFEREVLTKYSPIELSCKGDTTTLITALSSLMDVDNKTSEMMLISQRQIGATEDTVRSIDESYEPLRDGELEFFSFHINQAIRHISSISRPYELDEMFDKMFGQFCLGK